MTIGATLGSDGMVYLSIQANTAGWVALGVGGLVMNGSRLFIAFDTGTKQSFYEQLGAGHSHGDPQDLVVSKWAVKDGRNDDPRAGPPRSRGFDGRQARSPLRVLRHDRVCAP